MDKENNIVYVQTKKGIFKCYKSEQMHKPIYYPIESKTNGYIDYYDVIEILNIDDLYEKVKKQKEVIDKAIEYISNKKAIINTDVIRIFDLFEIDEQGYTNELLDILKEGNNE